MVVERRGEPLTLGNPPIVGRSGINSRTVTILPIDRRLRADFTGIVLLGRRSGHNHLHKQACKFDDARAYPKSLGSTCTRAPF